MRRAEARQIVSEISRHAYRSLRLSRDPAALARLREEILSAVAEFLTEIAYDRPAPSNPKYPHYCEIEQQANGAAEAVRAYPLEWFADKYDWLRPDYGYDTSYSAGLMLKRVGRIGR